MNFFANATVTAMAPVATAFPYFTPRRVPRSPTANTAVANSQPQLLQFFGHPRPAVAAQGLLESPARRT